MWSHFVHICKGRETHFNKPLQILIMEANTNTPLDEAFASNLRLVILKVLDSHERKEFAAFMKSVKKDSESGLPPNTDLNQDLYEWIVNMFNAQKVVHYTKHTKKFIKNRAIQYRKKYSTLQKMLIDIDNTASKNQII